MQIFVAGKGGSGKTMISATAARLLARRGHRVRAIDDDGNPNLGLALGIGSEENLGAVALPKDVARREVDAEGKRVTILAKKPQDLFDEHGIDAPDGIRLLVGLRTNPAGSG